MPLSSLIPRTCPPALSAERARFRTRVEGARPGREVAGPALLVASVVAYPASIAAFGPIGFAVCHAALTAAGSLATAILIRRRFGIGLMGGLFPLKRG